MSSTTAAKQFKFKISQPNLLCKTTGCNYYGNEVQEGYCSLCYKEYKHKQQQFGRHRTSRIDSANYRTPVNHGKSSNSSNKSFDSSFERSGGGDSNQSSPSYFFGGSGGNNTAASALSAFATLPRAAAAKLSFDSLLPSPISNFTKFEEKKKHQVEKKSASFRSVFRKSPTRSPIKSPDSTTSPKYSPFSSNTQINNVSFHGPSPRPLAHVDVDFENVREAFNEFLKPFPVPIKRDVTMKVKECANELKKLTVDGIVGELSDVTQSFYTNFRKKIDTLPIYQNIEAEEKDKLMDFIEKYFTMNFYKEFFNPISTATDDEMKDLELQKKIRQLNWTSTEHLDICLNERDKEVRDMIWAAITEIVEMDSVKPPQEKLNHISQCCQRIMDALARSKQAPASADDFLPALIYIVIKANPTRLQSNINYITRFSMACRLMSGETGYFFTNLCCAVTFIQGLNADSLNMPQEEFESYMSGTSVPPPGSWEMHFSESLHTVQEMSKLLTDLEVRQNRFGQDVEDLKNKMNESKLRVATDVEQVLKKTPLKFKPRKLPAQLDDLDPTVESTSLPSPLKPEVVTILSENPSPVHGIDNEDKPINELRLGEALHLNSSATGVQERQESNLPDEPIPPEKCTETAQPTQAETIILDVPSTSEVPERTLANNLTDKLSVGEAEPNLESEAEESAQEPNIPIKNENKT